MEYIGETTDETAAHSGSERIKEIHETVKKIRKSEKAGVRYMQRWEELAYAREDGKEEGIKEGRIKGEAKINKLGILLKEAGRTDDFLKSLSDEKFQQELIAEFGLQEA